MLVKDRMTPSPVTVTEETPAGEALKLIRERRIRRLPVLDKRGRLVGIISEKDLLYASPSPATSLSVYEVHYLIAKLQVKEVMKRKVVTTTLDTPLEDAARVMVDNKIGCLPVLKDGQVVGIITETDIFKSFLELMGSRQQGLRLTVRVLEGKGVLAAMTAEIARHGGNIVSMGTFQGKDPGEAFIVIKVRDIDNKDRLTRDLEALGYLIVDLREV